MQPNPEIYTDKTLLSIKLDTPSLYLNHNNSSTSRRQYSIPRSPRFPNQSKTVDHSQFYDLPSTKSNRSPSFGYGNKLDLSKVGNNAPSPDSYTLAGQFEKSANKGAKMGLGRELVKAVSSFDQKPFKIPGPGSYDIPLPKSSKKIILSGRIMDFSDKWKLSVPGPGAYKTLQLLDNNLKSKISKFESCKSGKFSKGEERNEFDKMSKKQNYPSPAKYNSLQHFQMIDRFPRHKGQSFGHLSRPSIALPTIAPGPGHYNTPSDYFA